MIEDVTSEPACYGSASAVEERSEGGGGAKRAKEVRTNSKRKRRVRFCSLWAASEPLARGTPNALTPQGTFPSPLLPHAGVLNFGESASNALSSTVIAVE